MDVPIIPAVLLLNGDAFNGGACHDTYSFSIETVLPDILRAVRLHLGMDVAFVSEFANEQRVFRYVDCASDKPLIQPGDCGSLEDSYCQRVVDGRLPELIQDASRLPAALELPVTTALPVGAHISVPIRLSDGRLYGTFCCFSTQPDPSLAERELAIVRVFAEFAGKQIERQIDSTDLYNTMKARVDRVLASDNFTIVYQPIYHIDQERIVGFEALTRFADSPVRPPDVWFSEAANVGLSEKLEMAAIQKALKSLDVLPSDVYISLNVAPANILNGAIARTLEGASLERIVIEVTEHVFIKDYSQFGAALDPLRQRGLRIAIDDAGAGYASFRHILKLNPDLIKLDMSLTRDVDSDRSRRALAAALIRFAEETDCSIIAEGVETDLELQTLRQLKVNKAQGFLIGRPLPLPASAALFQ
ncbi:MAG: EAL domain-containing protein [Kaiparowitsia implicata GSE-PSE-MK54-09C]|nr:EAL domain-containing protein [Kaiparowitsia implicata GSE-PSE-MK54-09C]